MSTGYDVPEGNFNQLKALIIVELRSVASGLKEVQDQCKSRCKLNDELLDSKFEEVRKALDDKLEEWEERDQDRHKELSKELVGLSKEILEMRGKVGLRGAIISMIPVVLLLGVAALRYL